MKTLVVMAAGMGSRFGGLKQIEPVGPNKEFIIDYSIYDAIKAGFEKIVFIIKEENLKDFEETISNRIKAQIKIEYAFQKMEDIPVNFPLEKREKPLGTAHAVYCARKYIDGNFAIINADDFYGYEAIKEMSLFLDKDLVSQNETYGLVGYKISNTITDNGSVKRGVCKVVNDKIIELDESIVTKTDNIYIRESLKTGLKEEINADTCVSMNLLGFPESFLIHLEDKLKVFLEVNKDNLSTKELLIPDVVQELLKANEIELELLKTKEMWYGMTYKEDKEIVVNAINKMIEDGIYPENLWGN